MFAIDLDICYIIFEDGWDVDLKAVVVSVVMWTVRASWWVSGRDRRSGRYGVLTSGKVPLEKTLAAGLAGRQNTEQAEV